MVNSGLTTPRVVRGDGNCLFNAIFLVLFGHENASSEIRLKTFFELFDNAAFYERIHVKYFIPDVSPPLASAIRQCTQIGSYSCTWTMHAASTVIGKPIKSVYPVVNGPADMNIKILNTTFKPRGSRSRHDITIMWSGGNTIGSFWKPCHFVPLIPHTVECSTINIDDYEQFPPLGKEEFTSTPAKSFSVPSVDPDTTINYSDISDPVLKATIASFVQSCQTESNSIESEHVMESIIDSESTSHVSEEAPIDSFVQLPETESDCHQSDHVMEFHLDV